MNYKYLIIPSIITTYPYYYRTFRYFNFFFKNIIKIFNIRPSNVKIIPNGEMNYYGRLFSILKKDQLNVLGDIHEIYFSKNIKKYKNIVDIEKYSQCFGFDRPYIVDEHFVNNNIDSYDCVLISNMSFQRYFELIKKFKEKKKIVAIFDQQDDPEVYRDPKKKINRNIEKKYFDIYFKQDLPLYCRKKYFFPVCPMPARNFEIKKKNKTLKYDFSFFGDTKKRTNADRNILCELIKNNFKNSYINLRNVDKAFSKKKVHSKNEMERILNSTKINMSPSGVTWNSYRHADLAKYKRPILLAKPNIKIIGNNYINGVNCLMYDRIRWKNNYKIIKKKALLKKIKLIINNKLSLKKLAKNYISLVKKFHTDEKRALQILEVLKRQINEKQKKLQ
jgi:hypothetical protein